MTKFSTGLTRAKFQNVCHGHFLTDTGTLTRVCKGGKTLCKSTQKVPFSVVFCKKNISDRVLKMIEELQVFFSSLVFSKLTC